jgi:hypothetical protein
VELLHDIFGVLLEMCAFTYSEAGWQMLGGWLPCPSSLLLKRWVRKVKWMCIIALAPEIGVAMAADQFSKARKMNT